MNLNFPTYIKSLLLIHDQIEVLLHYLHIGFYKIEFFHLIHLILSILLVKSQES